MSDSNNHAGFSFQISETPPPVRARDATPLADLDLDMGDFGQAAQNSPLPPRHAQPQKSAWLEEPVAPSAASSNAGKTNIEGPTEGPWTDQSGPHQALKSPAAPAQLSSGTPPAEQPTTATSTNVVQRVSGGTSAEVPRAVLQPTPEAAPKNTRALSPRAPRIKKISFPAPRTQGAAKRSRATEDAPTSSRTKFSKSISAEKPRPTLDSEPEEESQNSAPTPEAEMAPPEDLPGAEQEFLPQETAATWGSDTPTAREIWKKARTSWHTASRQAVALSGQGLRASKALAETVNEKVRERLRDASEERSARAHLKSERETAPLLEEAHRGGPSTPSVAGRVILGLARSAGRKVAAPASALAAAAVVYFAGSHFLGADASVALSKAVKGPEIPELGTLENDSDSSSRQEKSDKRTGSVGQKPPKSEKASSSGPPPMETEVTEMPKGMSWPGKGLIEVVTSKDELVYVDGVFTGRGPLRRIPVSPGEHEVSIRADGNERKGSVEVQAGKNTRAVFKSE